MKLIMDERLKHRLIGMAVFVSICAIVVPALMKKSSQRFDRNIAVAIQLPPKPVPPHIVVPTKSRLFEKVKVAQVTIPSLTTAMKPEMKVAKAQPLKDIAQPIKTEIAKIPTINTNKETKLVLLKNNLPKKNPVLVKNVSLPPAKPVYAVQLALFSQQGNALSLVNRLKTKGFKASYKKVRNKKDKVFYKVLVGALNEKNKALALQGKLASAVQIKGFIVPTTGVS